MFRLGRSLLAVVALFGLGAATIAVSVFREHSRLAEEISYFDSWVLHKATQEFNSFSQHVAMLAFAQGASGVGEDEVRMRLDVVLSRFDTLAAGKSGEYMRKTPERQTYLAELAASLEEIERLVEGIAQPAVASRIIILMSMLDKPLARFAAEARLDDSERNARLWERMHRLQWQFWTVLGCLAFAALILMATALHQHLRIRAANIQLRKLAATTAANAAEFQDAIASLADGLILWDAHDRMTTWNRRCEELLPHLREELRPGLAFADYIRLSVAANHPDWTAEARGQRVADRLRQRRNKTQPGEFTTVDGRVIEVRESPTSHGGFVTVYRDMTEERRLLASLTRGEAELQRALAAEREINLQQRQFVSMASHEFRTPLAIIDSATQRLLPLADAMPDSDLPKRVDRIRSAVARMVQIIDRTLSTARLDEGRVEFEPEPCDLRPILLEICERQRGIAQRIAIAMDLPDHDLTLEADPRMLDQVFTNLVANAVKYSGTGTTVAIAVSASEADVEVRIRDHGIGIPANETERLFTRFYRASTSLKIPGTGIGLHIVKQFVTIHGGSVEVRSAVQKGSTFIVRLPRRRPSASRRAVA